MPKKKRPGVGAQASILTRFIHPRQNNNDKQHRSIVVLTGRQNFLVNKKDQVCFTFAFEDVQCHAVARHFTIMVEGLRQDLFDRPEREDEQDQFKEPKIKWRKSMAKRILYGMLLDGVVPMEEKDEYGNETMPLNDVYHLDPEFAKYRYDIFRHRLNAIRNKIKDMDSRAALDEVALENYKANHKPSLFSHKGYIQYQGSTIQELLLDDLAGFQQDPNMKPKDLWMSRQEYMDELPLHAFRDKIYQEIRTDKYIRTLRARDEGQNV
ncbi:MAG: hypothetical protein AAGM67_00165 [Bacteroidota bacterium]